MGTYPRWIYYPNSLAPPDWVKDFIAVVSAVRADIDSSVARENSLSSDTVLKLLEPGLRDLHYSIEDGKSKTRKLRRPVLFGEGGEEQVAFEVDAFHEELGVLVEIEAGRGAQSNAVYRDLVRSSLIVGASYLALGVMAEYHYANSSVTQSFQVSKSLLDAIFASGRLRFPFQGILLFGY